ncbi:MAG TPA: glycosyltransferase [Gaiellaceae bacterium]|nr:glycosyltransferase [Gaiellaceae bacterium]
MTIGLPANGLPAAIGVTPAANGPECEPPPLAVVVPTRNEADNIAPLLDELDAALPEQAEIIFVDDSTDATPAAIEDERARRSRPITLVHRAARARRDGLAGAVAQGLRLTTAEWVCVLDADLQHPPALVPRLLERARAGGVDVVVASRYCGGGGTEFGRGRSFLSRVSTGAAKLLFRRSLRDVSDPMSGFFLVRRAAVPFDRLRPRGFKILLEILVRGQHLRVAEVPFRFGTRHAGESKASLVEAGHYLWQLALLRLGGNLGRFLLVGLTGLAVNSAAFLVLYDLAHVHYLVAAICSTQFSTTWNFVFVERWVYAHRRLEGGVLGRYWRFAVVNNLSLLLRGPAMVVLVSYLGTRPAVANVIALAAIALLRFGIADVVIWASPGGEPPCYRYRIHDQVSVESEVRLRELEPFRVDEQVGEPTIRVRLGSLSREQSDLVSMLASLVRHIRYDEGLGRFGFAVDIAFGEHVEIVASPLLRHSPHVLYTNVVEPTLRWCFAERGFALAHAACIAAEGRATLITAKTDTGKTTTILKTLDAYTAAFLSDDLTLVRADGRVFTYPKPLTISRHTLGAVKTPLLGLRERLGLVLQSRVHSRTGRRFGQLIARFGLPAATINAFVQWLVPPPKYRVERLVPGVPLASEAQVERLVVIERGGNGVQELTHDEAVAVLLANSDDAYNFPPYPAIEHFLRSGRGRDLRARERQIVEAALDDVPALAVRSETMDWWQRIPGLIGLSRRPEVPVGPAEPVVGVARSAV